MIERNRLKLLIRSYAADWIVTIFLGLIFLVLETIPGFKRQFSLEDRTLYHPYAVHERVPPIALYMLCGVAPFVLQLILNYFTVRSWWDVHNSTLGLVLSLALAAAITEFTKVTVGRPRPDLISRCIPRSGAVDPTYGLSDASICTQTDHYMMEDGWRSFPSGHSSLSFAGLGFLAFYVAGKLHLFDKRGCAPKAWAALTPLSAAALIAISRTMDYRHHATDVLTGSLLGFVAAYFSYRQYYPSLASPYAHRPYSPRIPREDRLPMHAREVQLAEQYTDTETERELAAETIRRDEEGRVLWKDDDGAERVSLRDNVS
ncbi:phosphatidic acid phosphatase type 2/haloperoxidase [Fomitopsis serialis]|uniref:phosphatidic acid phosphatase type 2/haloperoxidase n=1 Tax=Fomitopsis serialis TaxID=139415 RepID=UPI00200896AA|nr:phosphatidic acid phosphatase type 2/haloperoxidase [Neoantrodia serialis]KAH9926145.1 phosphatidic acid phosphatase type 2/haloperoxidase [Neoantrodia serialis]